MPLFTTDLLERSTLDHRILRDSEPPPVIDAICFFGQTQENDRIALKAIAERWKKHCCPILVGACGRIENGVFVVRGSNAWVEDLRASGVEPESILVYLMSNKFPPSTDAEAYGMIEVIKKYGWSKLVVTVPPLHAVRAFVSLVSACKKSGLDVSIWSAPSEAPSWDEVVCHSGGMLQTTREGHIFVDAAKTMAYCLKGDHLTAKEVLEYLRNRGTS